MSTAHLLTIIPLLVLTVLMPGRRSEAQGIPSTPVLRGDVLVAAVSPALSLGDLQKLESDLSKKVYDCVTLKNRAHAKNWEKIQDEISRFATASVERELAEERNRSLISRLSERFLGFFRRSNPPAATESPILQKGLPPIDANPAQQCENEAKKLTDEILRGFPRQFPDKTILWTPYFKVALRVLVDLTALRAAPFGQDSSGEVVALPEKILDGGAHVLDLPDLAFGNDIIDGLGVKGIRDLSNLYEFRLQRLTGRDTLNWDKAFADTALYLVQTLQDQVPSKPFLYDLINKTIYPLAFATWDLTMPVGLPLTTTVFALRHPVPIPLSLDEAKTSPYLLQELITRGNSFFDKFGIWFFNPFVGRITKLQLDRIGENGMHLWEMFDTRVLNAHLEMGNCFALERMPSGKCPSKCGNAPTRKPSVGLEGLTTAFSQDAPLGGGLPANLAPEISISPFGSPTKPGWCDPSSGAGGGPLSDLGLCMGRFLGGRGAFSRTNDLDDRFFACTMGSLTGGSRFSMRGSDMPLSNNPMCKVGQEAGEGGGGGDGWEDEHSEPVEEDPVEQLHDEFADLPETAKDIIRQPQFMGLMQRIIREDTGVLASQRVIGTSLSDVASAMAAGMADPGSEENWLRVEIDQTGESGGRGFIIYPGSGGEPTVVAIFQDRITSDSRRMRQAVVGALVELSIGGVIASTADTDPDNAPDRSDLRAATRRVMNVLSWSQQFWSCTDESSCGTACSQIGMWRRHIVDCIEMDDPSKVPDKCKFALCEEDYISGPGLEACVQGMEDAKSVCNPLVAGPCNPCVYRCVDARDARGTIHVRIDGAPLSTEEAALGCCGGGGSGGGGGGSGGSGCPSRPGSDLPDCRCSSDPRCSGGEGSGGLPPVPGGPDI